MGKAEVLSSCNLQHRFIDEGFGERCMGIVNLLCFKDSIRDCKIVVGGFQTPPNTLTGKRTPKLRKIRIDFFTAHTSDFVHHVLRRNLLQIQLFHTIHSISRSCSFPGWYRT